MSGNEIDIDHPSGVDIPGVLVVNPLPWSREISGRLSKDVLDPRGWYDDPTSTRHHQDREMDRPLTSAVYHIGEFFGFYNAFGENENFYLPPTEVPGFGYTVVPTKDLIPEQEWSYDERSTVETDRFEITFDREHGGIASWYDRQLECEWVDEMEYPLGGFVYERVGDETTDRPRQLFYRTPSGDDVDDPLHPPTGWQPDWHARREGAASVTRHRVRQTPEGIDVTQRLEAPGVDGPVTLRFLVPEQGDSLVVEAEWQMGLTEHPEATYLAFPFDLSDATAYVDVGGQAMQPGSDQLPGSCFDYYTAQRWVELASDNRGMTVGCPLNPMVQFGDFHFGDKQESFSLDDSLLLGWVTNNYWDTNFRAHQPGPVRARYHLRPHEGSFDEAAAHRFGLEAEHWDPLVNSIGEEPHPTASLPAEGTALDLPEPPILTLQVRPERDDTGSFYPSEGSGRGVMMDGGQPSTEASLSVLLRNASDEPTMATIGSGFLTVTSAADVGLLCSENRPLDVENGTVTVELDERENKRIRLACAP